MTVSLAIIGMLGLAMLAPATAATHPWRVFIATAYSIEGTTASGEPTHDGIVAADPDVLPIGTKIQIEGAGEYSGVYTVLDTGPGIDGHEIDIFVDDHAEAKEFGRRKVRVRILKLPGNSGGSAPDVAGSK